MSLGEKYNPGKEAAKGSVSNTDRWALYSLGQIDSRLDKIDERLASIEKRLRWIERPLWTVLGGVAVLIAILKL